MILSILLGLVAGASGDSAAISNAKASLEIGDTLGAIEILQEWSSENRAGQELTSLLGALHMPDEQVEPNADTVSFSRIQAPQTKPSRLWYVRADEVQTWTNTFSWSVGAGTTTRLGEFGVFGRTATAEGGVTGAMWNDYSDAIRGAFEPVLVLSMAISSWDLRWNTWAGLLGDGLDAGSLASVFRSWSDSAAGMFLLGAALRVGANSSSYLSGFCHYEKKRGNWVASVRTDLRLRRDQYDPDSTSVDSLRLRIQKERAQSISRVQLMWTRGPWMAGPALDLDLRSSLASDSWPEGDTRRSGLRREGVSGANFLARYTSRNHRWIQSRLGWIKGFSDAEIDPEFAERHTGIGSSISFGGSF